MTTGSGGERVITCLGLSPAIDVTYGVEDFRAGGIHRPGAKLELPGGKSLNVARALATLGAEVVAVAPVGGPRAAWFRDALRAENVPLRAVETVAELRTCVSVVDSTRGGITEIYENAPPIDDAAWSGILDAVSRVGRGRLVVSGSVPPGREQDLATALGQARESGARLALDVRGATLGLVLDQSGAELVKVNRVEAEELVGAGDVAALAARLRSHGAATAIVTDGANGSVASDPGGTWRASPLDSGPFTVGSGDTFLAGLVAGLDRADPLPVALRAAAAAAAANARIPGAARFDRGEAHRLEREIEVRRTA